jgi:hypothetical protein
MEKEKSKSKGNFFSHLFVEEIEVPDTNESKGKSENKTSSPTLIPTVFGNNVASTILSTGAISNGTFDEKIYNGLHQTLETNDSKDISYNKYIKAKKSLDAIPGMTDALKYTSAFATMQANNPGLNKDLLLKTADNSLQILDGELKKFNDAVTIEKNNRVNSKLQLINSKTELIAQKSTEIQKLQEEVTTLQNEMNQSALKIEGSEKNFNCTLEIVKNEINTDKTNITNFLK